MPTFNLVRSPEERTIATVDAADMVTAKEQTPKPYNKAKGEVYAQLVGAHGWPLVPSVKFPGETMLACPSCGESNSTLGTAYAAYGTGSRGQGRLGDPGSMSVITCNSCGLSKRAASAKPVLSKTL